MSIGKHSSEVNQQRKRTSPTFDSSQMNSLLKASTLPRSYSPEQTKLQESHQSLQVPSAVLMINQGEVQMESYTGSYNADTQFELASLTKQFTAMAILTLFNQKKLDISTSLSELKDGSGQSFLANLPNASKVTVQHLLEMASGYPQIPHDDKHPMTRRELLETINKKLHDASKEIKEPGNYEYNNINYYLLTIILERLSNQTYDDYLQTTFFKHLGMTKTSTKQSQPFAHPLMIGETKTFSKLDHQKYPRHHEDVLSGAGALKSTPNDLAIWTTELQKALMEQSSILPDVPIQEKNTSVMYGLFNVNKSTGNFEAAGSITNQVQSHIKASSNGIIIAISPQFNIMSNKLIEQAERISSTKIDPQTPLEYHMDTIQMEFDVAKDLGDLSITSKTIDHYLFCLNHIKMSNDEKNQFINHCLNIYNKTLQKLGNLPGNHQELINTIDQVTDKNKKEQLNTIFTT
ncbi:hypothetical protein DID73_00120 [Candidatus Marinamargulisbacteria bacterium SCGC AG-343-K17]|nr:hypothetical protein DID73_00120 [Candidatus Marinamargulisbacteria bacterium SCGC AG-343-K17]